MDSQTPSDSTVERVGPKMLQSIPDLMASLVQLNEDSVQQVRKTAEDPPRVSVIDLIAAVTGYTSHAAANVVLRLKATHPELIEDLGSIQFPGRGQRSTKVCTEDRAQQILARLGNSAAEFRATGETLKRKHAPKQDDLYIMKYSCDDSAVKIGRSNDVKRRKHTLEAGQNFFMEIVAIFPGKGNLENEVHRNLQDFRSRRGAGREWFNICAADAAAICSNTLKELAEAGESSPTSHCRLLSKLADVDENAG